jgi:hypothetical protein
MLSRMTSQVLIKSQITFWRFGASLLWMMLGSLSVPSSQKSWTWKITYDHMIYYKYSTAYECMILSDVHMKAPQTGGSSFWFPKSPQGVEVFGIGCHFYRQKSVVMLCYPGLGCSRAFSLLALNLTWHKIYNAKPDLTWRRYNAKPDLTPNDLSCFDNRAQDYK